MKFPIAIDNLVKMIDISKPNSVSKNKWEKLANAEEFTHLGITLYKSQIEQKWLISKNAVNQNWNFAKKCWKHFSGNKSNFRNDFFDALEVFAQLIKQMKKERKENSIGL